MYCLSLHTYMYMYMQLRAPGCPVIIVGTHLDAVSAQEAKELEEEARTKYSNTAIYPKVSINYRKLVISVCMGAGPDGLGMGD